MATLALDVRAGPILGLALRSIGHRHGRPLNGRFYLSASLSNWLSPMSYGHRARRAWEPKWEPMVVVRSTWVRQAGHCKSDARWGDPADGVLAPSVSRARRATIAAHLFFVRFDSNLRSREPEEPAFKGSFAHVRWST
jgi:hypothetical protein